MAPPRYLKKNDRGTHVAITHIEPNQLPTILDLSIGHMIWMEVRGMKDKFSKAMLKIIDHPPSNNHGSGQRPRATLFSSTNRGLSTSMSVSGSVTVTEITMAHFEPLSAHEVG